MVRQLRGKAAHVVGSAEDESEAASTGNPRSKLGCLQQEVFAGYVDAFLGLSSPTQAAVRTQSCVWQGVYTSLHRHGDVQELYREKHVDCSLIDRNCIHVYTHSTFPFPEP